MCSFKCITGLLSENPLAVKLLTSPKNSWNLQKSTFILLFFHFETNWARKSFCKSDLRFQDCLVARWLPTTSIVVLIETIFCYQFKSIYLKGCIPFALFCLNFWNLHEISDILKKEMTLIVQVFWKLLTPKDLFI